MGNLKFISKITLVYFIFLLIVVFYGYMYFIKPLHLSVKDKVYQLDQLSSNIKTIQAQTPAREKKEVSDYSNGTFATKVFDPYLYGFDSATGHAFFLDLFLKKVKNTNNKVIEFSFSTENPSGNISSSVANSSATTSGLNKQIGNFFTNGTMEGSPSGQSVAEASVSLPIDKTTIKLELVSTYDSMQKLLESLLSWKYLVSINSVEISDDNGVGGKLRANLVVELYLKNKNI